MTARELIESLGVIAEAPDGVKRLRELVLGLAVRGKLVGQDPADEPAALGVERSRKELAALPAVRGRGAATNALEGDGALWVGRPMSASIPAGWCLVDLSSVARLESGHTPDRDVSEYWNGTIPWIGIRDARENRGAVIDTTEKHITEAGIANSATRLLPAGTVCLSRTASVGYTVIMGKPMCTSQDFVNFICSGSLLPKYLQLLFQAENRALHRFAKGAVHLTIYFPEVKAFHVLVPPATEQHRIVAKVDELMAFLDKLEAAKAARDATRTALRNAALAQLRDADGPDEVEVAWGRIAGQMQELFSQPEDIGPLRQAVLQLAVRGRLVRQEVGHEPAAVLLERMTDLQTRGVNKSKVIPAIDHASQLFAVPDCWRWTRLDRVCDVRDGTHATPKYVAEGVPLVTSKNLSSGKLELANTSQISPTDHFEISKRSKVSPGDVLFAMIGSIGNPVRVDTDVPFSIKNVALFKPFDCALFNFDYLMVYLRLSSQWMRDSAAGGVQQFIALGQLRSYPIPLPPLAEQHRIVAKVDELMAVLDNLETRLKSARELQAAFAAAAVHHLELEVVA